MKTLLFCASYAQSKESWNHRWRRWLDHHLSIGLCIDQTLIVDDGSPVLPNWDDYVIVNSFADTQPKEKIVLYQHSDNLGFEAPFNYPGLYRSLQTGMAYAKKYGFERVLNVESDAFILSNKLVSYINNINNDWIALWEHHFNIPELGINIAAGNGLDKCCTVFEQPYNVYQGKMLEIELPFTKVEKSFVGARYGEFADTVPENADYANQIDLLWQSIYKK